MPDIPIGISIHAAPKRAVVYGDSEALHLQFTDGGIYPNVMLLCDTPALAADLATAINDTLERHRAAAHKPQVGCEDDDGLLIVHDRDTTCEVCAATTAAGDVELLYSQVLCPACGSMVPYRADSDICCNCEMAEDEQSAMDRDRE